MKEGPDMKLYMKEKVFSWTDQFTVKDAEGRDKYFVEGEFLSWGKKLHVRDAEGREVAFIKQEVLTLMPRYSVFMAGREVAQNRQGVHSLPSEIPH